MSTLSSGFPSPDNGSTHAGHFEPRALTQGAEPTAVVSGDRQILRAQRQIVVPRQNRPLQRVMPLGSAAGSPDPTLQGMEPQLAQATPPQQQDGGEGRQEGASRAGERPKEG